MPYRDEEMHLPPAGPPPERLPGLPTAANQNLATAKIKREGAVADFLVALTKLADEATMMIDFYFKQELDEQARGRGDRRGGQ
jgi:hypothetical protein